MAHANNIALAWSFQDTWWFGEPQSSSIGNVIIIYTYPDEVQVFEPKHNNPLQVGVTLQYIKDKFATANWVVFSNVSVYLLNSSSSSSGHPIYSESNTSQVISPGESYNHFFSLKPREPIHYNVFLKLTALFGPGGGALESHEWNASYWYNRNPSGGGGNISPEELRPLNVVKNEEVGKHPNLTIRFQNPYGQINKSSKVKVCEAHDVTCKKENNNIYNTDCKAINGCKEASNGAAMFDMLRYNTNYTVIVPKTIDVAPGKIRANFSAWSDGQRYPNNRIGDIQRNVTLNSNLELLALYKIQYSLKAINADDNSNVTQKNKSGWYDGNDQATYSTKTLAGTLWTKKFDHWEGEIPTGTTTTQAAGSLLMDGPKTIKAEYDLDLTYISVIVAAVAAIPIALDVLVKKRLKLKCFFLHLFKKRKR
jgi:hypothetical protein